MRLPLLVLCSALVLAACGKKSEQHHEDKNTPQEAPTQLKLVVTVGGVAQTWGAAEFAKVPKSAGTNKGGAERDVWPLRDLVHANVGPTARVVSVTGSDGKKQVEAWAWDAADRTPVLHSTRRGTLKFRWVDHDGTWLEAIANDVTAIEVEAK